MHLHESFAFFPISSCLGQVILPSWYFAVSVQRASRITMADPSPSTL